MEKIKPKEPSDHIQVETDSFPPADILSVKDTEEQPEYKIPSSSSFSTAIELERDTQNLHSQHVSAHFQSKEMQKRDKEPEKEHSMTQKNEGREQGKNGHSENSDILCGQTIERRVTWNHKLHSDKNSKAFPQQISVETFNSNGPHYFVVGGLKEKSALNQTSSSQFLLPNKFVPFNSASSVLQEQSQKPDLRQDSCDENESQTFTRISKSPRLQRKRPMHSQPSATLQGPRRMSAEVESSTPFTDKTSISVSASDENLNTRRPSKTQDHLVLKMASVKQNRGVFWFVPTERLSESETELRKETQNQNSNQKMPKLKSQRSGSLPEMKSSPLQGLLNRAKEREKERGIAKREETHLEKTSVQSSSTVCTAPSPSPSDGEKEGAAEERDGFGSGRYVSHTGMESSVDINDYDRKNRYVFVRFIVCYLIY